MIVPVLIVAFVATLVRSAFGFGEALIAVPLLAFWIPIREAAPLALLFSMTVAIVVVVQDRKKIHLSSATWLVLATLPGIPLGMLLLTQGHPALVKAVLGALILAFSLWCLSARRAPAIRGNGRGWLVACGFCAGVLGGAYAMNGPPLVLYGAMRRWPAPQFRATLQAYFLPAGLFVAAGFWISGLWSSQVLHLYLFALPALIPALVLETLINRRLRGDVFLRIVYLGLVIIGAVLVVQGLGARG
ncbi:MAG: sulfite exporter TauE/SafE family protein [Acidobacteriaceae bacterium]